MEGQNRKSEPSRRALVTGATGFAGSVLVRKLVSTGFVVRAIARPSSNIQPFETLPIEWVRGEIFDAEAVEKAVQGVSHLFHLATAYRDTELPDDVYDQVDLQGTKTVAQAAAKEPSLRRFIHISTCGVHGHIEEPPADENYRMKPGDIYQQKKAEAENWIRAFSKEKTLPLTVVRPCGIYGPGDRRLFKLFEMASRGFFPLIGKGRGLYHLIHVEDLADFMIHAAIHPLAWGEIFLCGNPNSIPLQDLIRLIADEYGRSIKFIRLPEKPLMLAAAICEKTFKPLHLKPPIFKRRIAFFTKDRAFNTEKMTRLTGFIPRFSYQEGVRQTLQWYLDSGWIKPNAQKQKTAASQNIERAVA